MSSAFDLIADWPRMDMIGMAGDDVCTNTCFKCVICGKVLSSRSSLDTHLMTHTGEKPYKCQICLKTFRQRGHLDNHSKMHTGEKPFKCSVCGKSFRLPHHLKKHAETHMGKSSL